MNRVVPWLTVLLVLVFDRATKMLIMARLEVGEWVAVVPGFSLSHVHNRGIAFSLFSTGGSLSRIVLHVVIVAAVALIAWMLVRDGAQAPMLGVGLGLILGGAVGNLVDRVLYGWVVDFIHVWVVVGGRVRSWPDFNLADSAITVGACLLILHELLSWRRRTRAAAEPEGDPADAPRPD
jgi:signal peptidase II